jgi:F-type H+-transporting ATPase subunit epsilon
MSEIPRSFHIKVITPRLVLVEADVEEASLPGVDGLVGILPGHVPMVIALGQGTLSYRHGTSAESHEVQGGYAEIAPDRVLVFTRKSERHD